MIVQIWEEVKEIGISSFTQFGKKYTVIGWGYKIKEDGTKTRNKNLIEVHREGDKTPFQTDLRKFKFAENLGIVIEPPKEKAKRTAIKKQPLKPEITDFNIPYHNEKRKRNKAKNTAKGNNADNKCLL